MAEEEEVNYVTLKIQANSTPGVPRGGEVIYDEVKTKQLAQNPNPDKPGDEKKSQLPSPLCVAAAALVVICVISLSVIIALSIHFNTAISRQSRENIDLTAQNLQLRMERADLQKKRDDLNWTIGVILEYDQFPVDEYCPQKECEPCLSGWLLFQSSCYFFSDPSEKLSWSRGASRCRDVHSDMVLIETQEEQDFLNNHTKSYESDRGYWIGLKKDASDEWMWDNGKNLTVMFWLPGQESREGNCGVILSDADPLANWRKARCDYVNPWICERRALIKLD
ncbi:asialoglycoprotein receptor 2-like [Aulostomus maculatus]